VALNSQKLTYFSHFDFPWRGSFRVHPTMTESGRGNRGSPVPEIIDLTVDVPDDSLHLSPGDIPVIQAALAEYTRPKPQMMEIETQR